MYLELPPVLSSPLAVSEFKTFPFESTTFTLLGLKPLTAPVVKETIPLTAWLEIVPFFKVKVIEALALLLSLLSLKTLLLFGITKMTLAAETASKDWIAFCNSPCKARW